MGSSRIQVKAVIFDCFGVFTEGTWKAFLNSLPDTADTETASSLNRAYDAGLITKEEFLQGIKDATGRDVKQVEELTTDQIVKNSRLLDYVRELRKRGYKIAMLSNIATNWIRDDFLTPEEQSLFDQMIFSFEVGMTKPDPRIFMLACERLGVAPEEAVLVDDIDRYCTAAEAEGLHTVVYQDFKQMKATLEPLLHN
jgi:epoxide hydrolase-like predicted phosphatase